MLRHRLFLGLVLVLAVSLSGLVFSGNRRAAFEDENLVSARQELVDRMMLTDFAIWTEARYTRHPSQADIFTPFQDFPASLEHFPAGSLLAPPATLPKSRLLTSSDRKN